MDILGFFFNGMLGDPLLMMIWMVIVVVIGFSVCSMGLQNGVEKIPKAMMSCLLLIMVVLVVRSVTLPGAGAGLRFYLMPDFGKMADQGITCLLYTSMLPERAPRKIGPRVAQPGAAQRHKHVEDAQRLAPMVAHVDHRGQRKKAPPG